MKYFKKIAVLTLCFILSFNLIACKSKDIKKSDDSSSAASCDNIDFSNVGYNSYNFEGLTFNYPSFLGVSKEGDNYITLATQDNSVSLKVYKEKSGTNFRNLYNYDMSSLKNINYDSYKDIRFSISGTDDNSEYYKSSILLGNNIFSFMMIYPVEYLDEFDSVVTNIYKAFVANLDCSGEQKKNVASNSTPSKNTNGKLQAATVEYYGQEGPFNKYPDFIPLGDYVEGKQYDTQYGLIIGKNIFNNKNIDDPLGYNKVYNIAGCINFPDFLIPSYVPTNEKDIAFTSRDDKFYADMGYFINHGVNMDPMYPHTEETYLQEAKEENGDNILYSNIKNGRVYIATIYQDDKTGEDKISISCRQYETTHCFHFLITFPLEYYRIHKSQVNNIFNEMDRSFEPLNDDEV